MRAMEPAEVRVKIHVVGGGPAGLYFDRLRDAIGCDRIDAAAGEAMVASISVRLRA